MEKWTILFAALYLYAWYSNAHGSTYDLGALATWYGIVAGVGVARYGINSTLNSPRGQLPQK